MAVSSISGVAVDTSVEKSTCNEHPQVCIQYLHSLVYQAKYLQWQKPCMKEAVFVMCLCTDGSQFWQL